MCATAARARLVLVTGSAGRLLDARVECGHMTGAAGGETASDADEYGLVDASSSRYKAAAGVSHARCMYSNRHGKQRRLLADYQ